MIKLIFLLFFGMNSYALASLDCQFSENSEKELAVFSDGLQISEGYIHLRNEVVNIMVQYVVGGTCKNRFPIECALSENADGELAVFADGVAISPPYSLIRSAVVSDLNNYIRAGICRR